MRTLLLLLFAACVPAYAAPDRDRVALPSKSDIRAIYLEAHAGWNPVPENVLTAFRIANGRSLYPGQTPLAAVAYHLSGWVSPQRPMLRRAYIHSVVLNDFTDDEILNWYVNEVFMGQGCYGVEAAATAYFGKSLSGLVLEEYAYLAALPWGPSGLHPLRSRDRALKRRDLVLEQLASEGVITAGEAASAAESELVVRNPLGACRPK